jgi:hypothetical protein
VGGKLCLLLNQDGLVVAWDCATANASDIHSQPLIKRFGQEMVVPSDAGFHAKAGDPSNLKVCRRKTWQVRMVIETVLSMLTLVNHFKHVTHRAWDYFETRLAYTVSVFNALAQWYGLQADADGIIHLSIAEFSL